MPGKQSLRRALALQRGKTIRVYTAWCPTNVLLPVTTCSEPGTRVMHTAFLTTQRTPNSGCLLWSEGMWVEILPQVLVSGGHQEPHEGTPTQAALTPAATRGPPPRAPWCQACGRGAVRSQSPQSWCSCYSSLNPDRVRETRLREVMFPAQPPRAGSPSGDWRVCPSHAPSGTGPSPSSLLRRSPCVTAPEPLALRRSELAPASQLPPWGLRAALWEPTSPTPSFNELPLPLFSWGGCSSRYSPCDPSGSSVGQLPSEQLYVILR